MASHTVPPVPATSRLTLFVAALAQPLAVLALLIIAILLVGLGVAKLLPAGTIDTATVGQGGASIDLFNLASGGVIAAPWGGYLIGALQILLGIGLLVPPAQAMAALGCLLAAVAVAAGFILHWSDLTTPRGLEPAGVALLILFALLLAASALGARGAARRTGASA